MHPGIEIRLTTPAGVIVCCDSDFAHYAAIFGGAQLGQWVTIAQQFLAGDGAAAARPTFTVEVRAVELADAVVDDVELAAWISGGQQLDDGPGVVEGLDDDGAARGE